MKYLFKLVMSFKKMKTLALIHFLLSCTILSYSTLTAYVAAGIVTQIFIWIYSFFPFLFLRNLSLTFSGATLLSHVMLLLISTVRAYRYFLFPVKEQLLFSLECIVNVPLVLAQVVFLLQQIKVLLEVLLEEDNTVKFQKNLYRNTLYIMFFHDFVYAWILVPFGGVYVIFAFSQFVVHTLMMSIPSSGVILPHRLNFFRVVWFCLCVQHMFVLISLREYNVVLGFTGVYLTVCTMYLINSSLQNERKTETKSIE
jgi:hypothetical protein